MNLPAPLGKLARQLYQVTPLRMRIAPHNPCIHVGGGDDHRGPVPVSVVERADGVRCSWKRANLCQGRATSDARMPIGHGDHAGLMEGENKTDPFLLGNSPDELLAARPRQPENVLDPVRRSHLQISLRGGSFSASRVGHSSSPLSALKSFLLIQTIDEAAVIEFF